MSLQWNGEAVNAAILQGARRAMDGLMASCVQGAKSDHEFRNRTGILEGSIHIAEFSHESGDGLEGKWGSKSVKYASSIELGTGPYIIRNGFGRGILIHHPGHRAMPFLVPQAEDQYPSLPDRIRAEIG